MKSKVCNKCQVEKSTDNFGKLTSSKDGLAYFCKECNNLRYREWSKDNAVKRRNSRKKWEESHPEKHSQFVMQSSSRRRARLKNNEYSPYTLDQIIDTYGIKCYLCENNIDLSLPRRTGKFGWENGLHIDHVVAISNGGTDTIDNVRPSHGICNLKKRSAKI
jgi:5-methylcytosine-specific restriction endonuclease McrA